MKAMFVALITLAWLVPTEINAVAASPPMRPYSGIGVLMLAAATTDAETAGRLQLYEEPSIGRRGELNIGRVPRYEWIFGANSTTLPLIVIARKGEWLKVTYDDAGREAWLNPRRRDLFQAWDAFFKGQTCKLLSGLQKRHYQFFRQPGKGPLATLTPKQLFKVVKLENDWALVITGQDSLCWLRWRDEDGRLLLGLARPIENGKQ